MYLCIRDVLSSEQLSQVNEIFARQDMIDGRKTAGIAGMAVKDNLQVPADTEDYATLNELVTKAVLGNQRISLASIPKAMRPIRFARYTPGMSYGVHTDNSVMGNPPSLRADLSFTLFLSPPESYDGGELVVHEPGDRRTFKLPAGSLVLYPSNSLHEVAEVTRGTREVAVGWIQSLVRDPEHRRIMYELEGLRVQMLSNGERTPEFDVLSRNVAALWHMWVEI